MSMRPFGFPRQRRLLRSREFASLHKLGRRSFTGLFIVYILPNQRLFSRLGVSINAGSGIAVERNRLKRALREFFRLNQDTVSIPVDIHIAIKRGARARNASAPDVIEAELRDFFAKTGNYIPTNKDASIKSVHRSKDQH